MFSVGVTWLLNGEIQLYSHLIFYIAIFPGEGGSYYIAIFQGERGSYNIAIFFQGKGGQRERLQHNTRHFYACTVAYWEGQEILLPFFTK
jgi:hypothetical protein